MVGAAIDRPIDNADEDLLSRNAFVRSIARRLIAKGEATGITVGLVGSWGSGKSSVLNLLTRELEGKNADNYGRPLVLRFDPWLVSGRDDLIASFFVELVGALRKRLGKFVVYANGRDQRTDQAVKIIEKYGDAISPLFRMLMPGLDILGKLSAGIITDRERKRHSLQAQREEVRRALTEFEFPIVILVDELDRVDDAEVRTMAQLIRSIADFSSISYLIAYDEARVVEALGGGSDKPQIARGRAYLEKIVQLRLPLPFVRPAELKSLLRADYLTVLKNGDVGLDTHQRRRLDKLIDIVVPHAVSTGRDLRKIIADVGGRLVGIEADVDPVDALAYSIIQLKSPALSDRIDLSMKDPDQRLALREYYHLSLFQASLPSTPPYPSTLPYSLAHSQEGSFSARWEADLFAMLWPLSAARTPSGVNPLRVMFGRPLLILAKHSLPDTTLSVREIQQLIEGLDYSDFSIGTTRQLVDRLNRFQELAHMLNGQRLTTLVDLIADHLERSAPKDTSPTTRDLLAIAGALHRCILDRVKIKEFDLAGSIARLTLAGKLTLPLAMLARFDALKDLDGRAIELTASPLSMSKQAELDELLRDQIASGAGTNARWRSIFLPILAIGRPHADSFSSDESDPLQKFVKEIVASRSGLSDISRLWFDSDTQEKRDALYALVDKADLLSSLRKHEKMQRGENGSVLARYRRMRDEVGFYQHPNQLSLHEQADQRESFER